MKIRTDFVTNSSSSSFIIRKRNLTEEQLADIDNVAEISEKLGMYNSNFAGGWNIFIDEESVKGSTYMDNFSMHDFLTLIGVDKSKIVWRD